MAQKYADRCLGMVHSSNGYGEVGKPVGAHATAAQSIYYVRQESCTGGRAASRSPALLCLTLAEPRWRHGPKGLPVCDGAVVRERVPKVHWRLECGKHWRAKRGQRGVARAPVCGEALQIIGGATEQARPPCTAASAVLQASGHFSQVVWKGTAEVGCGYNPCVGTSLWYGLVVCNYSPPGNILGWFSSNVDARPDQCPPIPT